MKSKKELSAKRCFWFQKDEQTSKLPQHTAQDAEESGEQRIRARISVQEGVIQGCTHKVRVAGERGHSGASPGGPWAKQETAQNPWEPVPATEKTSLSNRNPLKLKVSLLGWNHLVRSYGESAFLFFSGLLNKDSSKGRTGVSKRDRQRK